MGYIGVQQEKTNTTCCVLDKPTEGLQEYSL